MTHSIPDNQKSLEVRVAQMELQLALQERVLSALLIALAEHHHDVLDSVENELHALLDEQTSDELKDVFHVFLRRLVESSR
ncbi:hypothetical protein [Gallibacterium sp. AGMB14963]|uniref:hypothetical protein n=1 Tax=Gallibacterium faecale TaxID=3019086 RepID=UPI0022F1B4B4|nr:hypothetical protein [Gallibacterium sp. AGMB14963]MDA3979458.1 hypothetical protein [Gallibacterium sp. AGMB14963]